MINFRLLGRVSVYCDGESVEVGVGKQRALLAVLLLNANEVVTAGTLIDLLWSDPPPSAAKILQNCVVKLRRLLPEQCLLTRPRGYELRLEEGELDVDRWLRLIVEARKVSARNDPAAALQLFDAAQAEWRGVALCDVGDAPFVAGEARRLDELRLDATMDRTDAQLALSRHRDVVRELEPLVQAHPLHERLRAQLMLALYRSGRQTDSLEVYREGRRILVAEIGVEPGPALRQLEQEILNQAPALDLPEGEPTRTAARSADAHRRSVVLAAVALAAVVTFAAVGFIHGGSAAPKAATPPDSVAVVDPTAGRVITDLAVGTAPSSLAVAGRFLWVANQGDESLTEIDLRERQVSIPAVTLTTNGDSSITSIAVANGGVWAIDSYVGSLTRVPLIGHDLYRAILPTSDRYPNDYLTLAAGGGHLWITSSHFSAVFELETGSAHVQRRIAIPGHPLAAAVGRGSVWCVAALGGRGVVARIDTAAHAVVARIPLPGTPTAVATGFGAVWVAVANRNLLYKIDESTNAVVRTIAVPGGPVAVAVGAGGVWVVAGARRRLVRLDPASGATVESVALEGTPHALAVAGGRVWVAGA